MFFTHQDNKASETLFQMQNGAVSHKDIPPHLLQTIDKLKNKDNVTNIAKFRLVEFLSKDIDTLTSLLTDPTLHGAFNDQLIKDIAIKNEQACNAIISCIILNQSPVVMELMNIQANYVNLKGYEKIGLRKSS